MFYERISLRRRQAGNMISKHRQLWDAPQQISRLLRDKHRINIQPNPTVFSQQCNSKCISFLRKTIMRNHPFDIKILFRQPIPYRGKVEADNFKIRECQPPCFHAGLQIPRHALRRLPETENPLVVHLMHFPLPHILPQSKTDMVKYQQRPSQNDTSTYQIFH